ncbi:MAG: hypothetical protein WA954_07640 [Parerythrobacter sp.]
MLALMLVTGGCTSEATQQTPQAAREPLGLSTSLPLYWAETADLGELLDDSAELHRVRKVLETKYTPVLLDGFSKADDAGVPTQQLADLDYLVLAQPAALPPADLVAIDAWVRKGGRILVFADPMLTEESEFAFGDRRRPLDIVMLGPLFARWGLLLSANASAEGVHKFDNGVQAFTRQSGRFSIVPTEADATACTLSGDAVLVRCAIGAGTAVLFADAAILEATPPGDADASVAALRMLLSLAFDAEIKRGKDG